LLTLYCFSVPDFRSPKTGLYANLARLNLPHAEAVFDIGYFRHNPEPFYVLAKELYPGRFFPTVSHVFVALLATKGLLFQLFTQNIDCLERAAGVPSNLIVEAHGSFATQRCIECRTVYPDDKMKEHVENGGVPRCIKSAKEGDDGDNCTGLVKPDIVFFGEQLPDAFRAKQHYPTMADLVLIMGTSLQVYPFAGLAETVREGVPRVLFNLERVGSLGSQADDVLSLGDCDAGVRKLADKLGWRDELEAQWRGVVGHKEAERQLKTADAREKQMEEEMAQLADKVETVLRVDDDDYSDGEAAIAGSGSLTPARPVDKQQTESNEATASTVKPLDPEQSDSKTEVSAPVVSTQRDGIQQSQPTTKSKEESQAVDSEAKKEDGGTASLQAERSAL
jgi:NAD-dependent histone deacetylase SIR2